MAKLKGWVAEDESMHRVEFEVDEQGIMSARKEGEIWDYSDALDDYVDVIDDEVFTERTDTFGCISYKNIVKLSEWFETHGAKEAAY